MTGRDLEALADLLARDVPLDEALRALQPDGHAELLKRLAAVHQFDDELAEVLRSAEPALPAVAIDDLVRAGSVEPVPGRERVFRVPPSERRERYAQWWSGERSEVLPDALRSLSERVLEHLEGRDGADVEALYHLLIVDRDAALDRFDTAFTAADAAFDLARCQDLVDVVVERLPLLGPEAAAVCNQHRRRLRSRAMWVRDWHRSARFLLPEPSEEATAALLEGERTRVLTLWSQGGMGKTSYLRWLIARRCVPAGHACVRIDFDEIAPLVASREPWLLLLEAAHQLDQQLPDAPFHELLAQYAGQRERLRGRGATRPSPEAAAGDIGERFAAVLGELPPSQCAVIALDTLEVALLMGGTSREQVDLAPMLDVFAQALRAAPALRLVLTARYDLAERVAGFERLFPDATTLQLAPFSPKESRRYLTEFRGIAAPLADRIADRTDGIPFKLAFIADIVEARPDLDPAELDDYVEADLKYLMDRIVGRIDPELRPLVRYGVAPRRLDRSFVHGVIGPLLEVDGVDRLWRALKRHTGRASWITLDPLEVDAVRFDPVVLKPMRELLRGDPIHDELHRRAESWFELRARDDPANATRFLCEAVYHRFQRAGPAAEGYWRQRLRDARAERRGERRRALAAEVLSADYVDERGEPRPWRDGRPLITAEALRQARWELAFAAVQLAAPTGTERRDAERLEAARALADLEHLRAQATRPPPSETQMALVQAGIRLIRGDIDSAKPYVDRALRGHLAREDRLWLWLAYAGAASSRGEDVAAAHFRTALSIAERGPRPDSDLAVVNERLALHHAEHDRIDRALAACEAGAARATGRQAFELALVRAQLELRRGAPSAALAALPGDECEEVDVLARREIVRVRALLAAGRPRDALECAERAGRRFSGELRAGGPRLQAIAAEGRELRGKVRAALLDVEGAMSDFEEAADWWSRVGASDGVCRCWVRGAALHLRGIGNFHEAALRVDQARRARAERGLDAWTRSTLVGADLLARTGQAPRARRLVDDAISALRRANRPPRALVAAAVHGLALSGGAEQDRYLRLLCEQLPRIKPPTARLPTLDGIESCQPLSGDRALRSRLRRLVPSPARTPSAHAHLPPPDLALLAIRDAELDRLVGHPDHARRTLEWVWQQLAADPPRAAVHDLLSAAVRTDARPLLAALARRELNAIEAEPDEPGVRAGSALVEAAAVLARDELGPPLLAAAEQLLDDHGAAAGAWPAVLLELRADEAEHARQPERALELRRRAAELYEGLGDDVRRDRALESAPVTVGLPAVGEHEARVTIRLRDGALTVAAQWVSGGADVPVTDDGIVRDLLAAADSGGGAASAPVVKRVLADPMRLGEELAALLRAGLAGHPGPTARLDLGLRTKPTVLRALPWELGYRALERAGWRPFRRAPRTRGEPADVRGLQGALNRATDGRLVLDGIFGPATRAALEEFQRAADLPCTGAADPATVQRLHARVAGTRVPRVAIVRPSRVAEDRAFRGSRQSGVPVDWRYDRAGFRPLVLDAPSGDELRAALSDRPMAILHLNVGLVVHHGSPAIDLLGVPFVKRRTAATGRLTATALDRVISRDYPAPLVVLDITAPKSRRELTTQLLLRNAFAAELSAVGTVRALLATGLAAYGRQERLYDALIGALREGCAVYDAARAVHGLATADTPAFEDAIAFRAAALFARTPSIRFPGPT